MNPTPLKKARTYGPDVILRDGPFGPVVEKTYRARTWPIRLIGRLLVARESYIYEKLEGVAGIPPLCAAPDSCTLVTGYMGGANLRETAVKPDAAYFRRLETLIDAMHDRGVIHLDLRNRRNYGIDPQGHPYLVDFATALYLPKQGPLFKFLCLIDRSGSLKVKGKLAPELLDAGERRHRDRGRWLSRLWLPSRLKSLLRR
ncbi:MAG: serine/threonine protein kinase [Deltaproteobacteria bacterium ADurb.Bin510]|nr:MAG: serine/threonine protein kinase [Deltaproteobacteria bacterium ADurb.Bin510]